MSDVQWCRQHGQPMKRCLDYGKTHVIPNKPWWCKCRYGVIGPICTHCGRTRPEPS